MKNSGVWIGGNLCGLITLTNQFPIEVDCSSPCIGKYIKVVITTDDLFYFSHIAVIGTKYILQANPNGSIVLQDPELSDPNNVHPAHSVQLAMDGDPNTYFST